MQSVKLDRFLRLGICALAAILVFVIYTAIHEHVVVAGDTAPDFVITADNGRSVSVPNFGGKVLVLNFWASWCGPCVEEAPSLKQLSEQFRSAGLVVVGVSVDRKESAYADFLKRFQLGFPNYRDPAQELSYRYGSYKFPETYLIDRSGKVMMKIIGSPGQGGMMVTVDRNGTETQTQLASPEKSWMDPAVVNAVQRLL